MLQFAFDNVSPKKVGAAHGLDLNVVLNTHRDQLEAGLDWLFNQSQEAGGWKRWVDLDDNETLAHELNVFAESYRNQIDDLVILGIGGSSLGGLALLKALLHPHWNLLSSEKRQGWPRFHFIDNVDADVVHGLFDLLDPKRTLVNVVSKSGTTSESMAAYLYAKAWLLETFTEAEAMKQHMVFTTDKNKGVLRRIADENGVTCFEVPDDVGGRFSIFSAVGLLPAALCGLNPHAFLDGLRDAKTLLRRQPVKENPACIGAALQVAYYQQGKPLSVLMPYSTRLAAVSDWYVQLWAESLGKAKDKDGQTVHSGPTPLKAVGATDQHSQIQLYNEGPNDKIVTFIQLAKPDHDVVIPDSQPGEEELAYLAGQSFHTLLTAEFEATRASLVSNQRPNVTITLPELNPYTFAQLLYFFEVQTALAGWLLNIDPFDQPGVELAKKYTYALMGRPGFEHLVAEAKGQVPASV
jgi:glucose-6-phosphate isomerase